MLLSNKNNHNMQMQLSDTVRYREAVSRLKRILYERPSSMDFSRNKSPLRDRKIYHESFHNKDVYDRDPPDKMEENEKSMGSLFEMVKRQDDLIGQLEKENLFLKTELVSTAEASKEIAQQNESFRKRLTETLIQMETSPDISAYEVNEKTEEIISCLKEERERLVDCIRLQEDTILSLRHREADALDKVKQAVGLAEDSQRLSDKVRDSSDQNRKDLQHQLMETLERLQIVEQHLKKSQEKEKVQEAVIDDHEKNLQRLEEDSRDKDLSIKKRELDYQNQIDDLKRNLKEAQASKERLEKVLQEQRNTSEATFKRLEALLDRRNLEAESFATRRKSQEKQIVDLKEENQRLLKTINDLAKEKGSNTDDAKFAKQVSNLLPDDFSTKSEIKDMKATLEEHQNSISQLHDEVSAVRQEMSQEIEGLRSNFEELCSTVSKDEDVKFNPSRNKYENSGEPILSSHSEGYESMRETGSENESGLMPDDRRLQVSVGEKDVDEMENGVVVAASDNTTARMRNLNEENLEESLKTDMKTYDKSKTREEELKDMPLEIKVDSDVVNEKENLSLAEDYSEVSPKESKANSEEEKERDESISPPEGCEENVDLNIVKRENVDDIKANEESEGEKEASAEKEEDLNEEASAEKEEDLNEEPSAEKEEDLNEEQNEPQKGNFESENYETEIESEIQEYPDDGRESEALRSYEEVTIVNEGKENTSPDNTISDDHSDINVNSENGKRGTSDENRDEEGKICEDENSENRNSETDIGDNKTEEKSEEHNREEGSENIDLKNSENGEDGVTDGEKPSLDHSPQDAKETKEPDPEEEKTEPPSEETQDSEEVSESANQRDKSDEDQVTQEGGDPAATGND